MQWQEAMPLSPRRAGADLLQLQLSRMLQFWVTVRLWVGCIEQSSRTQTYAAVRGYALVVMPNAAPAILDVVDVSGPIASNDHRKRSVKCITVHANRLIVPSQGFLIVYHAASSCCPL